MLRRVTMPSATPANAGRLSTAIDSADRHMRSAQSADRMDATQPGERTGSRPQPPEAGARSASLEAGRAPGYPASSQLLPHQDPSRGEGLESARPRPQIEGTTKLIAAYRSATEIKIGLPSRFNQSNPYAAEITVAAADIATPIILILERLITTLKEQRRGFGVD